MRILLHSTLDCYIFWECVGNISICLHILLVAYLKVANFSYKMLTPITYISHTCKSSWARIHILFYFKWHPVSVLRLTTFTRTLRVCEKPKAVIRPMCENTRCKRVLGWEFIDLEFISKVNTVSCGLNKDCTHYSVTVPLWCYNDPLIFMLWCSHKCRTSVGGREPLDL